MAEGGDDVGDDDERVAAEDARQAALVLGLELVVELLLDARADLGAHRLGVEARRDGLHQPQDHPQVRQVGADGGVHPRVLDLDGDVAVIGEAGAVDLADRRGRDRDRVEGLEHVVEPVAVLGLEHLPHVLEGHLGGGVAQLGELGLEGLAVLLGHQADVEERHDLADLHRGALHRAQGGDDLLGRLDLALGQGGLRGLVVTRQVRRAGAHLAGGLPGGETPHLCGAAHAGGGDGVLAAGDGVRIRTGRATGCIVMQYSVAI